MSNGIWTLSNLVRGRPSPPFHIVKISIPCFSWAIQATSDIEILANCAWALTYLADSTEVDIDAIIAPQGLVRRLLELLYHQERKIVVPALRTVGSIVSGNEQQT